jgi:hypothetical protein
MKAITTAVAATLVPMTSEGAAFSDADPVLLLDGAAVVLADASALPEAAVELEEPSESVEEEMTLFDSSVVAGVPVVVAGSSIALEASSKVAEASVPSPLEKSEVVSVLPLTHLHSCWSHSRTRSTLHPLSGTSSSQSS